ncbi:spindle assembly abnormal protein 6 homolog [Neodiprion virginianus]|uniref:spindle assembly abnormal protein 6 homolog n=1 Tax=Neodiprion fabricii TaxID=2872261 RepID=UPI001ED92D69|nr:spindle assembly abnormal protein 6 homolog [Neodiprion fabricii]XP_046619144.1 spindle assembly abnormal protein 6 homolog [Neodiprion virginianus]
MNYLNNIAGGGMIGDPGLQLNNVEILYTRVQRVYIKPQHKEERQRDLRVNVEIHAGISPVCRKSLCVLLSDDDDPCFLYSLFVNDDDFKVLKAQQGLLVDFDNFATQLICLLEQCQIPLSGVAKNPPKFLLLLAEEAGDWTFKLVETNNFKHLCHLSLNIAPSSDTDIKVHMAMKIKQLKENCLRKDKDIGSMETRLNDLTKKLEVQTKELEQIKQKYQADMNQMQIHTSQQISAEKDKLAQATSEFQRLRENEKSELEQRHGETLKQLHTELAELRTRNLALNEKLSLAEASNKEQVNQLQTVGKELSIAQRDLALMRKQNSKLDVDYHERDKMVNNLKTKVAVLEQEIKDKCILLTKHTEMIKTGKEQKQHLEDLIAEKDGQLQRKQNSLKSLTDELVKANEILTKLQNELASIKSKLKLRTSIALEQERLLDTKQKEVGQLDSKMEACSKEAREAKAVAEGLKEQLKALQSQLEEKDKIIKNNDNVISWLNRRLTDNQSSGQTSTIGQPIMVPPSVQLTLPRTSKSFPTRFEARSANSNGPQASVPLTGHLLRNPIVQNPNINQTARTTARNMGVGVTDTTSSLAAFNKTGQITCTSTPLERGNILSKALPSAGVATTTASLPTIAENNNPPLSVGNTRSKSAMGVMQGGLRRAVLDKPLLPSAYFPKSSH